MNKIDLSNLSSPTKVDSGSTSVVAIEDYDRDMLKLSQDIVMMHKNNGLYGIASQDLTNSRVDVLSQSGYDESPSVSPNGKMVIYASQYGGRGVLSMVSLDGKVKIRLPSNQGAVQSPVWSPYLG